MKTSTKKIATQSLILLSSLLLLSCGVGKSDDLASRLAPGSISTTDKPLAWCNSGSSSHYTAHQKAFKKEDGSWDPKYALVKFSRIPSDFSNNTKYIQFYRWMVSSDGSASRDDLPLKLQAYDLGTNLAISDWGYRIGWSSLEAAKNAIGISDTASFFKRVAFKIDIRDPNGEYDVLRTAIFNNSSTDTKAVEFFDALMPIFNANPADYAIENTPTENRLRPQILNDLHPLKGTALSKSEYDARMLSYCDVFSEFR